MKKHGTCFLAILDLVLKVTLTITFLISVWGQLEKYFTGHTVTTSEFVTATDDNFQLPRYQAQFLKTLNVSERS
jgi:hypothetical protein